MEQKITNPFEVLDARLTKIEDLLTRLAGQASTAATFPDPSQQEYLTRREVADILDVCLTTVDHLSNAGVLRKYRSGRIVRFLRTEVMAAISGDKRASFFRQPKNLKP